jgi:hypothetical protein
MQNSICTLIFIHVELCLSSGKSAELRTFSFLSCRLSSITHCTLPSPTVTLQATLYLILVTRIAVSPALCHLPTFTKRHPIQGPLTLFLSILSGFPRGPEFCLPVCYTLIIIMISGWYNRPLVADVQSGLSLTPAPRNKKDTAPQLHLYPNLLLLIPFLDVFLSCVCVFSFRNSVFSGALSFNTRSSIMDVI